jgi:hypothetical protein
VALGHDLSLYAAAEGPLYWRASLPALYMAVSREVERQVRLHKVGAGALLVHRNHLVALALARAGVIGYRCRPQWTPDGARLYYQRGGRA